MFKKPQETSVYMSDILPYHEWHINVIKYILGAGKGEKQSQK
jgi:hypothetical protein